MLQAYSNESIERDILRYIGRYQAEKYLEVVYRILKYLNGLREKGYFLRRVKLEP